MVARDKGIAFYFPADVTARLLRAGRARVEAPLIALITDAPEYHVVRRKGKEKGGESTLFLI